MYDMYLTELKEPLSTYFDINSKFCNNFCVFFIPFYILVRFNSPEALSRCGIATVGTQKTHLSQSYRFKRVDRGI